MCDNVVLFTETTGTYLDSGVSVRFSQLFILVSVSWSTSAVLYIMFRMFSCGQSLVFLVLLKTSQSESACGHTEVM